MAEDLNNKNKAPHEHTSPAGRVRRELRELTDSIGDFFSHILDLREGLDRVGTVTGIRDNVQLRGSNVWMLIASTMIASIGLDLNSPAVIIGAMLISPLMSPILGIGLSIGINDRTLLVASLKNFGIAIATSLVTSAVYFFFSPLGEATSEILARTRPTALDVLVAFFGGIAGIVAVSRKDQTAAIPGVAIATALMPPLCVAGYGIASAKMGVFFGSFYLFFLNSVFIALSTYLIVRFLRFPYKEHINVTEKRRATIYITLFVLLVVLPSIYLLYDLLRENRQKRQVNRYVDAYFNNERRQAIKWEYLELDSLDELKIYLVGEYINTDSLAKLNGILPSYGLQKTALKLVQMDLPPQDQDALANEIKLNILKTIEANQLAEETQKKEEDLLKAELDSIRADTIPFNTIRTEIKTLYPELEKLAFAEAMDTDFKTNQQINYLMLKWENTVYRSVRRKNEERIREYMKVRYAIDSVQIIQHP